MNDQHRQCQRFRDIDASMASCRPKDRKLLVFLPHPCLTPALRGNLLEFLSESNPAKTEGWGYSAVKTTYPNFSHFSARQHITQTRWGLCFRSSVRLSVTSGLKTIEVRMEQYNPIRLVFCKISFIQKF